MQKSVSSMVAGYFQALAHPTRIEILQLLKGKDEMCVCEIVEKLKRDQSNISRHLNALKRAGIVGFRADGTRSLYKIRDKNIYIIFGLARDILQKALKENQKVLQAF